MSPFLGKTSRRFRVWIVRYDDWQPKDLHGVPPRAVALEPAERGTMSAMEAAAYAEAFNRVAITSDCQRWAVALPIEVRYEGEPHPGQVLVSTMDLRPSPY